jgi:TfoX/Sxy family transcriptional regulator of competence genes
MATGKEFVDFILDQLSGLPGVRTRAMMGEYVLYYQEKVVGGLYDNRLLVKPVSSALVLVKNPVLEPPYPGAKPLLLIENVEDRKFLTDIVKTVAAQLPAPKPKKSK